MTTDTDDNKQLVSALVDGQLEGDDLARGLQALASDPQAREAWQAYHLIGDVLRQPALAAGMHAADFVGRLSQRIAQEPLPRPQLPEQPAAVAHPSLRAAANDSVFRWKLVAGLASLAAVVAVGWNVVGAQFTPMLPQLAGGTIAPSANGPMLRDPRLDEMLQAHRQLGGATALQATAGGLHNASFEAPAR